MIKIVKKADLKKYGPWAFYVALILAVILAFFPGQIWAVGVLAIAGLVVGLLNISKDESTPFLLASIAWMVAGQFLQGVLGFVPFLPAFLSNVVTFVGPAAAVVAIMTLYNVTKN